MSACHGTSGIALILVIVISVALFVIGSINDMGVLSRHCMPVAVVVGVPCGSYSTLQY